MTNYALAVHIRTQTTVRPESPTKPEAPVRSKAPVRLEAPVRSEAPVRHWYFSSLDSAIWIVPLCSHVKIIKSAGNAGANLESRREIKFTTSHSMALHSILTSQHMSVHLHTRKHLTTKSNTSWASHPSHTAHKHSQPKKGCPKCELK